MAKNNDIDSDANNDKNPAPLKEGLDFYMEDGRFVLTEHYLRGRGYCCGNGCRHCPYGGTEGKDTSLK
ncbi:MAG: hypothetical protein ACI8YQ_002171 [Polaribacter sp.]|jgi:hypothetical protein